MKLALVREYIDGQPGLAPYGASGLKYKVMYINLFVFDMYITSLFCFTLIKGGTNMAKTEDRKEYLYKYQKEKLKRIPLDVKKEDYECLASAASAAGQSVNGFIKQAIAEKIEREG